MLSALTTHVFIKTQKDILNLANHTYVEMENATERFKLSHKRTQFASVSTVEISVYSVIALLGFFCNIVMIAYILCSTENLTVTSIYLLNLAASDTVFIFIEYSSLLVTFITKNTFHGVFGYLSCMLDMTLENIGLNTSAITIFVMSIDRYLAVLYPISSLKWRRPNVAKLISLTVWITSVLLISPVSYFMDYVESDGQLQCILKMGLYSKIINICTDIIYLGVPWIVAIILSSIVFIKLRTSTCQTVGLELRQRTNKRMTQLMLTIIFTYLICWLPFWLYKILKHTVLDDS